MILQTVHVGQVILIAKEPAYEKLYTMLSRMTGSALLFAERHTTLKQIQWSAPGDDWKPLALAPDEVRQQALHIMANARAAVSAALGGSNSRLTDNVLTTPSEDFIFYRPDAAGGIQVVLTAWGYRQAQIANPLAAWLLGINKKGGIGIGFSRQGKPVPSYPFRMIMASGQAKVFTTGPDGLLHIKPNVNDHQITVAYENGLTHTISLVMGQETYWIALPDIEPKPEPEPEPEPEPIPAPEPNPVPEPPTPPEPEPVPEPPTPPTPLYPCYVHVTRPDGTPVENYEITSDKGDKHITDANGYVRIEDMEEGTQYTIWNTADGSNRQTFVVEAKESNIFDYVLEDDCTLTLLEADGTTPLRGAHVTLTLNGSKVAEGPVDADGKMTFPGATRLQGGDMEARVTIAGRTLDTGHITLDPNEREYVLQVNEIMKKGKNWMWLIWVLIGLLLVLGLIGLIALGR